MPTNYQQPPLKTGDLAPTVAPFTVCYTESPLFDTARWVRNLETAFLEMLNELDLEDVPDIVVMEGDGV